ncbi:MAG TPA: hypothetical protein H9946_04570 [Candidatus Jeotgalibaca pullicola]|nr:hypothetical protein [Candidatus Jeotgalibaca pullicola]
MAKKRKKNKRKNSKLEFNSESNEDFFFIAGYTSWGFPYGTSWEEAEEQRILEEENDCERKKLDYPF